MAPFIVFVLVVTMSCFKGSSGLSCMVCHSMNGSNAECENNLARADYSGSLLQRDCRSTVGSSDPRAPMTATACVVLLGEYKDSRTKEFLPVVSRKCTAAIRPGAAASGPVMHCALMDPDPTMPREIGFINGCSEACFGDRCNNLTMAQLGVRFKDVYRKHFEEQQLKDPQTRLRFPSIFAVEENRRYSMQQQQANGEESGWRMSWLLVLGLVIMIY